MTDPPSLTLCVSVQLMPEDKSQITVDFIMDALPDVDSAEEIIVLARTLSYLDVCFLLPVVCCIFLWFLTYCPVRM
jgi:hypothetical protein